MEPQRPVRPPQWKMWALAVFGFGIGWTPVFAPIHELGHAIVAVASPHAQLKMMTWTETYFTGSVGTFMWAAGFWSISAFDAVVAKITLRRLKLRAAVFFLCHLLAQPFYAYFSTDYHLLARKHGDIVADNHLFIFSGVAAVAFVRILAEVIDTYRVMPRQRKWKGKRDNIVRT